MGFREVTEGVYLIFGYPDQNFNVTALLFPERVVLVDCGMRLATADVTRRSIEEFLKRKVEMVILTHFHSDHTGGLPAFGDCRIIASNLMVKNLKRVGRKTPEGFQPTFPNETFHDKLELQDGGMQLIIKRTGGHTDGSAYVYCPDHRVLAVGDNLTINYNPWGGARNGDPDEWVKALQEYLSLDAEYVIPGHGPVGGAANVRELLDYINNVGRIMKEMMAAGKTEEEILEASRDVEYIPSRTAHPSTLKRWYKIWRVRTKINDLG